MRLNNSTQDLDLEDEVPLQPMSYSTLEPVHRQEAAEKKQHDNAKAQILFDRKGFCKEGGEGDGY